jgi:hypothetical protein
MKKNPQFVARFVETCGSSEPAQIQRLLNISYQAAKNYLDGRLPSSSVLLRISVKTPYSIDWLLTGRGKKFIDGLDGAGAPITTSQIEAIARRVCVEVINELDGSREAAQPKVVVLQSSELMSEKVMDEAISLTGSQP